MSLRPSLFDVIVVVSAVYSRGLSGRRPAITAIVHVTLQPHYYSISGRHLCFITVLAVDSLAFVKRLRGLYRPCLVAAASSGRWFDHSLTTALLPLVQRTLL